MSKVVEEADASIAHRFFGCVRRLSIVDFVLAVVLHVAIISHSVTAIINQQPGLVTFQQCFATLEAGCEPFWPTTAYAVYCVLIIGHIVYKSGAIQHGMCACARLMLCASFAAWRFSLPIGAPSSVAHWVAVPGDSVDLVAPRILDVGVWMCMVVMVLKDAAVLFDAAVGVSNNFFAPIGLESCRLCGAVWEHADASECGNSREGGESQSLFSVVSVIPNDHAAHITRCPVLRACIDEQQVSASRQPCAPSSSYGTSHYSGTAHTPTKPALATIGVFDAVERASFISRWSFSWLNTFVHVAFTGSQRIFADPAAAAVIIPKLPTFMESMHHYALPSISLWRRWRLKAASFGDDGDLARGDSVVSQLKRLLLIILFAPLRILWFPIKWLGTALFLRFFVDGVTRLELQSAPFRNLYQLFVKSSGGQRFLWSCVPLKLAQDVLAVSSPVIVSYLVHFVSSMHAQQQQQTQVTSTTNSTAITRMEQPIDFGYGLQLCGVLFLTLALQTIFFQNYLRQLYLSATEATTVIRVLILEKVLVTPLAALLAKEIQLSTATPPQPISEGFVVSLAAVDAARCGETLIFLHNVWGHPLMVAASLMLLHHYVGTVAAVCSFLSLMVMIPINKWFGSRVQHAQQRAVGSGPRVALSNEVLSSMRLVKANVWEGYLLQKLHQLRGEESASEEVILKAEANSSFMADFGAILVCVVCFTSYYVSGGELRAEVLVPALASLNLLRFPLWSFPNLLSTVNRGVASMRKVDQFLGWSHESAQLAFVSTTSVPPSTTASSRGNAPMVGSIECNVPTTFTYAKRMQRADTAAQPNSSGSSTPIPAASPTDSKPCAVGQHVLERVVLRIAPGETVAVTGPVGSGKSSLILAILGELASSHSSEGIHASPKLLKRTVSSSFGAPPHSPVANVTSPFTATPHHSFSQSMAASRSEPCGFRVSGSIAYCSDVPWLRNESIRKNICMHLPFDGAWYHRVVAACALHKDLVALSAGDATVVGDKGVQLSGGQKARVALARALYQRSDVYLLDGVLDALDEITRRHIIKRVVHRLLRNKTVIMVTHVGVEELQPDRVLEVRGGGFVAEVPVVRPDVGEGDTVPSGSDTEEGEPEHADTVALPKHKEFTKPLVVVPPSESMLHTLGRAKLPDSNWSAIHRYLSYFGLNGILVLITSVFHQTLQVSMDVWFGLWISRRMTTGVNFLAFYALLGLTTACLSHIRTTVFFRSCVAVANRIVNQSLFRVFAAPATYLDTASVGTITSILSRDVDVLDRAVPESIRLFLQTTLQLAGILVFNSVLNPLFLLIIPVSVLLFYNVSIRFLTIAKEVRKLENRSVGGAVAILKEAFQGAPTIRALRGVSDELLVEFCEALDVGNRARDCAEQLDRWVGLRLEFISTALATAAAFIAVISSGHIAPAFAGVAVVNCLNTSRILLMLCRRIGMFQVQFMSVEQLLKLENVPQEALCLTRGMLPTTPEEDERLHQVHALPGVSADEVVGVGLNGVSLKYRSSLTEFSLLKVMLQFPAGSFVGLVGRSGSGKSTHCIGVRRVELERNERAGPGLGVSS